MPRVSPKYNLQAINPNLSKLWHPQKNGSLTPKDVTPRSSKKVWWLCSEGHEWEATVKNRAHGRGCPYCVGKLPTPETNLATLFPEVAIQWHPTKNKKLQPIHYLPQSNKKVWWKCNREHEWQARIQDRTIGKNSCPYCSHQTSQVEIRIYCELKKILPQVLWRRRINGIEIDVFLPEEKIAIEIDGYYWHRDRKKADWIKQEKIKNLGLRIIRVREKPLKKLSDNDSIFPSKYYDDKKVVDGLIKNLIPIVHQKHQTKLQSYLKGKGLINNKDFRKILSHLPGPSPENSLQFEHPQIATEWNFERNSPLLPIQFPTQSNKKVWWQCKKGHEWQALIYSRVKGNNCPYCSGRFATPENNLQILKPDIAKEWHPTKNKNLTPKNVTPYSHTKVWWKCSKGHEWQSTIANRSNSRGCPFCSGKKVSSDNNLYFVYPKLAMEWHPEKNGQLKPVEVTPGSGKKVWWKCHKGHEWRAAIYSRTTGNNCPFCSGKKVCEDNCLQTVNPKLASEWHPIKNEKLLPCEFTSRSNKKVWWLCNNGHEWEATINNRTGGRGCPYCSGRRKSL